LTGRFGVAVVEKLRISLAFMSAQSTDHHDDELGFSAAMISRATCGHSLSRRWS
jgi:hypothetical protein